ncbi:hypothetical protein GO491_11915 [Flavobacteriaceae bacterium Ap0902]|nr:hypothetical protein [Flavobacteriaceae bacterium Ap0902]
MTNLYKALAEFQQEVPVIHKGTQGYGYSYSDLPAIFEVINPLLKKHGLGFTQPLEGRTLKTIIFHIESGETIESSVEIPQGVQLAKMNQFQILGSAITYIRRYALSSILGLVTDKDTDANPATQPAENKSDDKPKVDKWLTEKEFNNAKSFEPKVIKSLLNKYNGQPYKDDGKVYNMKAEYRNELKKLIG